MPVVAWIAGTSVSAAVVIVAWLIGGWGGPQVTGTVSMFAVPAFAAFATACAVWAAAAARGRQRLAWCCLAVGLAGWALGETIWTYYRLVLRADPFPSIADVAYLIYPVGACLALLLFPLGHTASSRGRMMLDGVIVAGALFEISWVLVLRDAFDAAGGQSRFALVLSMAYPVTDVVIVTLALLILVRARRPALILLTLGNILNAVSDSAWVYLEADSRYIEGGLVDIGWIVGLLLVGLAALVSARTNIIGGEAPPAPSPAELWMPYVPVAVAAAVCTPWLLTISGIPPLLISSGLLISAVLARQFLVLGQNRRLLTVVAEQALRDPLTGVANRVLFHDRLTHAMQLRQRDDWSVAVLLLDIDDFKSVNDTLGHPVGDALLVAVAHRVLGCVRAGDTVARVGGDEFAVLMEGRPTQPRLVANRVIRAFEQPFEVDGHTLSVRPSAGLAVVPSAEETDVSTDDLLKRADTAMYSVKQAGSGGLQTYTAAMQLDTGNGHNGDHALLGDLRHAIDNVDLTLVYQPKFDLRCGAIVGVEALVRWPHPELGMLAPERFLPLVHRHGLVRSVTELVLSRALDDAAQWRACGVETPVAVNISAPSLSDLDLPNRIVRALAERNLPAEALTVEITEDLLVDNIGRARQVLGRLRARGIRVANDDFGSGYSALSYLRDLPVDEVKLDKNFVGPIMSDARAAAIVRAVIDLAHVLGVTTVAEGVENDATAARLREYGCDVAQGYFCSPPLDGGATLALLRDRGHCCGAAAAGPCEAGISRSEIELMQ